VGGSEGVVWLCDVDGGRTVLSLRGHEHYVCAVAFSLDDRLIVTGSLDNTARVWEAVSGKAVFTLDGHARPVAAVAFSPDGRLVASAEGERSAGAPARPHQIRFWDAVTGKELFQFAGHDSDVLSLAFAPDGKRLASGLRNSSILLWDLTGQRIPPLPAKELTARDLDVLWADLNSADAAKANAAFWSLSASPDRSVPFLKERLRPVPSAEPDRVRRWVADLDSDDFKVRDAATRELISLDRQIEPELRKVLEGQPSPEVRRRVETLLRALEQSPSGKLLGWLRAVRVLERVGTSEAREVLRALAEGSAKARLTQEAKATLERMNRP
jgi:dipeptidyl aminopeptidase/acylaminoacyl peptidase